MKVHSVISSSMCKYHGNGKLYTFFISDETQYLQVNWKAHQELHLEVCLETHFLINWSWWAVMRTWTLWLPCKEMGYVLSSALFGFIFLSCFFEIFLMEVFTIMNFLLRMGFCCIPRIHIVRDYPCAYIAEWSANYSGRGYDQMLCICMISTLAS